MDSISILAWICGIGFLVGLSLIISGNIVFGSLAMIISLLAGFIIIGIDNPNLG